MTVFNRVTIETDLEDFHFDLTKGFWSLINSRFHTVSFTPLGNGQLKGTGVDRHSLWFQQTSRKTVRIVATTDQTGQKYLEGGIWTTGSGNVTVRTSPLDHVDTGGEETYQVVGTGDPGANKIAVRVPLTRTQAIEDFKEELRRIQEG